MLGSRGSLLFQAHTVGLGTCPLRIKEVSTEFSECSEF